MKKLALISLSSCIFSLSASSEVNTINVDIKRMVIEVVKRNTNLIFDRMQNDILSSQIELEKSVFDPIFYVSLSQQTTNIPNSVDEKTSRAYLNSYEDVVNSMEFGIKGQTQYGTQWNIALSNTSKESNLIKNYNLGYDREYKNALSITLNQPLLKGYGKYGVQGKVKLAEAEKGIFDKKIEKNITDVMGSTIQSYWKYYSSKELKKSYENSLSFNEKIINILEKKHEAGEISLSEVLEAKSSILIRKAQIRKINSELKKYKNDFLSLLNLSSAYGNKIDFNLIETANIKDDNISLDLDAYYKKALEKWPDYQIAKRKLQKDLLQVKITQNQVKPQLDLIASTSTLTLNDEFKEDLYENEHLSWSLGLQFSTSLKNKQAINALKVAKLKVRQTKLEIQSLETGLYNAIDSKFESYRNSKNEVLLYNQSLKIKKSLLEDSKIAFNFGEKSIKDIITQEDDLIEYQNRFFNRLIDFKLSRASLDKAVGELYNKYLSQEDIKKIKELKVVKHLQKDSFGVIK